MFVFLLSNVFGIANSFLLHMGVGNKRRLIDVKAVAFDLSEGVERFLAFIASLVAIPLVPFFISTFQHIGKYPDLSSEETLKRLESFTCLIYGGRLSDINLIRHAKFQDWLAFRHGDELLSSYR